jgi:hypothetical protein
MQKLVESWIRAEKERYGTTQAEAIRRLNDHLGTAITHSRVAEWRRGVYVPSQEVLSALLYRTLPWAIEKAGGVMSPAQWRELEELLWVVVEQDGKRFIELL